jgi:hypothetical protein
MPCGRGRDFPDANRIEPGSLCQPIGTVNSLATHVRHPSLFDIHYTPASSVRASMPTLLQTSALPVAVLFIVNLSTTWYNAVSKDVPEPYLVSTP